MVRCGKMGQALSCCVQVEQSTVGMKEKFGKYSEVLEPGCHCVPWFLGYKLAGKLSLRVQQLDVRCETKTKVWASCMCYHLVSYFCVWLNLLFNFVFQDNVFVTVVASIQYRAVAQNAADAFYKLSNTKAQIQAYVFDGTTLFSHLLLSRLCVANRFIL